MGPTKEEKAVLRALGRRIAEIAALPIQETRRRMWKRMNGLDPVKPMVWIFEIPWHEMNVNDELTLRTRDPFLQNVEQGLRRTIYQWDHLQGDMVVEPYVPCPIAYHDSGIGIREDVETVQTDPLSSVVSRHFNVQIACEDDIAKIQMPTITLDPEATERRYACLCEVFDGVIPVRKTGVRQTSIAPWDELVRFIGVEQSLLALSERPRFVHKVIDRMTQTYLTRLDQFERLNLLSPNNDSTVLGGGYCYTDDLPRAGFDPRHVRPCDMWGRAMAQIFSAVSPAMHEEFALQYEMKYLKRFGLVYYGCCEPLDKKLGILAKIPNLRTISMSPWVNAAEAAAAVGRRYVYSMKPSPALLAGDEWDPAAVRRDLAGLLAATRDCATEVILKDISTVRYQPSRLWEWAAIAAELTCE